MIRRVSHQTDGTMPRFNYDRYHSKRESIHKLLIARNEGSDRAKLHIEHLLKMCAESANRNCGIASTILDRSKKYQRVRISDSQLNGLAIMAVEMNLAIAECHCPVHKPEYKKINSVDVFSSSRGSFNTKDQSPAESTWTPDPNGIRLFDTVSFIETETGELLQMTIVPEGQSNLEDHKISIKSPIAEALLGHSIGDYILATTPCGTRHIEVNQISR